MKKKNEKKNKSYGKENPDIIMFQQGYVSPRNVMQTMNQQPEWAATSDRMGYLTRYPNSENQTGRQAQSVEGFCSSANGVNKCLADPRETSVVNTSKTISGCPTCGSLRMALVDRTNFDQFMFNFYNTQVLNQVDTNLLNLSFAK